MRKPARIPFTKVQVQRSTFQRMYEAEHAVKRRRGRPSTFSDEGYVLAEERLGKASKAQQTRRLYAALAEKTLGIGKADRDPLPNTLAWFKGRQAALTALGRIAHQVGTYACHVMAHEVLKGARLEHDAGTSMSTVEAANTVRKLWDLVGTELVQRAIEAHRVLPGVQHAKFDLEAYEKVYGRH